MAIQTRKRLLVDISSSDHADSDDNDTCCSSSEDEYQLIDDDDDDDIDDDDDSDDDYVVDGSDEEDEENKGDDDVVFDVDEVSEKENKCGDENTLYNCVIRYLQENKDLQKLSLDVCKTYLRRHGLRVSGTKDECVKRIHEHWRIKDGKAENLYPRSSFVINCTGDVCKGDVVLFTQKVYDSFDKMKRNGKVQGRRVVTGRVVKESYGAAKQQHTFTVEVLWSKGIKKLPPLFPLLIKGRNLYRLKTYRQRWTNEAERKNVLDEKHRRGARARSIRDKRKGARPSENGRKSQKVSNSTKPSQSSYTQKDKFVDKDPRILSSKHSSTRCNQQQRAILVKKQACAHTTKAQPKPFPKHFPGHHVSSLKVNADSSRNYSDPGSYNWRMPSSSTSVEFESVPYHGPTSVPVAQRRFPHHGPIPMPPVVQQVFPYQDYHIRPPQIIHGNSWQFSRLGQRRYGLSRCSQGCYEYGCDQCVIGACQRCCRMKSVQCYVHR